MKKRWILLILPLMMMVMPDLFDDRRLSAVGAEHIREAEARAHQ